MFVSVNGETGRLGEGSLIESKEEGVSLGIEYDLEDAVSRIVMRDGQQYLGMIDGDTRWLDVTDHVGRISRKPPSSVRESDDDYVQLRQETYDGVRYAIFEKTGEIVALDDSSAIGSRFLYWKDDAGVIDRHVSIVSIRSNDDALALITVADRDNTAELPQWHPGALRDARSSAVRASAALRYNVGMPQPVASLPSAVERSFVDSVASFLVAEANAQIASAVLSDLGDEVIGDLKDATIENFLANLPPPGARLSDYLAELTRSGYSAVKDYFTEEQLAALARSVLENTLKKMLEQSIVNLAPYMGYYGLAALVAGFVVDEIIDLLFANVHGEPHIRTFDGINYGFQAAGEFVYFTTPGLEVQQRFTGSKGRATSAQATAVRVGDDHVIESYFEDVRAPGKGIPIILDGEEVMLDEAGMSLDDGSYVGRLKSDPAHRNLIVVAPRGSHVIIENLNVSQNVLFGITEETRAHIKGGLGGVPDGDTDNDFTLRSGTVLDPQNVREIDNMYGRFAASWRVTPDERLFTRGSAQDFLGSEYTDLPSGVVRLSDFSQDQRDRARIVCTEAGVLGNTALEDCTYDVLVTGDPAWAQASGSSQVVRSMWQPQEPGPKSAVASNDPKPEVVPVSVQLTASASDATNLQWVLINQATEETTIPESDAASVEVMLKPGIYDVIVSSDAYEAESVVEVAAGAENAFNVALTARDMPRPFDSPSTAPAGEIIRFSWEGPGADDDLIFIARPDLQDNRYRRRNRHDATDPSDAVLVAPAVPGTYEIRYFSHANGTVLFRQPIEITEPRVSITAPAQVNAGNRIAVAWAGPGLPDDGLFIARPDMDLNRYWRGDLFHDVEDGSPADLVAPVAPGSYEIRYFSGANGYPLARAPLEVLQHTVEIDAPRTVAAGSEFEFSWSGPDADGDFLFVASPDMGENEYFRRGRHRTADGPVGRFVAPAESGTYEIRYYSGRNASVLAKRALIVR